MKNGFTLIEILVVVAIIAVVASIGLSVFKSVQPHLQLGAVVREMATNIRYAQQLAVTEQNEHCLRFFIEDKKYKIIQCQDSENEIILREKTLPETIKTFAITGFNNNEVRYNSYGAVKKAGEINLENIEGETKKIQVKVSGFVKIID